MLDTQIQQPGHMIIVQRIINNLPIPAAFYEGQIFQPPELM
jgi:hypothetical protein